MSTDVRIRLGLDLVEVASIKSAMADQGDRYLERVYTAAELADCRGRHGPDAVRLAGRFAVKEATLKVLPASDEGLAFTSIELVAEGAGVFRVALHGRAQELADGAGVTSLSVSLSGDRHLATAVVVAEYGGPDDGESVLLRPTR